MGLLGLSDSRCTTSGAGPGYAISFRRMITAEEAVVMSVFTCWKYLRTRNYMIERKDGGHFASRVEKAFLAMTGTQGPDGGIYVIVDRINKGQGRTRD